MKTLFNENLCKFLKIDPNKEYNLNDIIKLFDKYKYENGYFIHEKIINLLNEKNVIINWKFVNKNKFKGLILLLRIPYKHNSIINKFNYNDIGKIIHEITI